MQKNKSPHTLLKIEQKVKKAIYEYGLIEDGDKILIGLSGGKDSLALTEMLAHQRNITVPKFSIVAAHIELENVPYKSDIEYLSDFCHKNDVEFHHISTKFAPANDKKKDEKTIEAMHLLKKYSYDMKEALLTGKIDKMGELLKLGWENKKKTSS